MGFLMKRNEKGIISGRPTVRELMKNLFPELSERAWNDLIPETEMNVKVDHDAVRVQFPCAGCCPSDFDVEASGMFLTVKVPRRDIRQDCCGNSRYTCCERSGEEFQESIKLPVTVVPSEAKAKYSNGVLEITLPRLSGNDSAAKQIRVQ